jgi:hypothetical protein
MKEVTKCDFCGDPIEADAVVRGERVYCCEACAFEASRSADCGGRSDSTISRSATEPLERERAAR